MPATQSGTYNGQGAGLAVDGNTSTVAFADTGVDGPPAFWQVDLTVPCIVYRNIIIAPLDGSA